MSLLANVPLLERCSKRDLAKIASIARDIEYPAAASVVREGEPGSELFIVVDGEPFWGVDHLVQVDRWLETGGW